MHLRNLRAFLERPNNALFITGALEQWRWLEDPNSVMWVNHNSVPQRILGVESEQNSSVQATGNEKGKASDKAKGESVPWPAVNARLAQDLRALPKGYVTLASFDATPKSPEPLRVGSSYEIASIDGCESPFITFVVIGVLVATLAYHALEWSRSRPKAEPS